MRSITGAIIFLAGVITILGGAIGVELALRPSSTNKYDMLVNLGGGISLVGIIVIIWGFGTDRAASGRQHPHRDAYPDEVK